MPPSTNRRWVRIWRLTPSNSSLGYGYVTERKVWGRTTRKNTWTCRPRSQCAGSIALGKRRRTSHQVLSQGPGGKRRRRSSPQVHSRDPGERGGKMSTDYIPNGRRGFRTRDKKQLTGRKTSIARIPYRELVLGIQRTVEKSQDTCAGVVTRRGRGDENEERIISWANVKDFAIPREETEGRIPFVGRTVTQRNGATPEGGQRAKQLKLGIKSCLSVCVCVRVV